MVAMHCVFCVFWQDKHINGSDAVRVSMAGQRYQLQRCNACFLWPDNDDNGSECFVYFDRTAILMVAMQCVFFCARTTISIIAMQCVFFMAGQRYQW